MQDTNLTRHLPTLAIVGRPNVGKSTLFNRLIGRRRAIVGDEPGITRDRIYGTTEWNGRRLRVIDTGGIIPEDKELIPAEIYRQAKVALDEADAVVMVVDSRTELAKPDLELSRLLLKTGKPLFLAVNKVDNVELEPYAENFRRLGIQNLLPVSAEHGNGVAELLEAVLEVIPDSVAPVETDTMPEASADRREIDSESALPQPRRAETDEEEAPVNTELPSETKIAIIGRPNVGKSTLLNLLTGTSRAIVSPIAGTTRDAVDELVERDGQKFRFIDTAGIRRKGKTDLMAEKLSVVMARKHMEAADVSLLIIDASEGVTALDANIAGYAHESGRSVIIIVNKWDLVLRRAQELRDKAGTVEADRLERKVRSRVREAMKSADQGQYEQQVRTGLKFLHYAPVIFTTATVGKNVTKIFETIERVAAERRKRVTTGEMNRFIESVDFERASVPISRRVKIMYMTQARVAPPTFILFTDKDVKLHFAYERFLENQIRQAFGFEGTPIWIKTRPRRKRERERD
ncbi:MAG TPA: ribosome biogenesis GTPase Der [Terriglobales bacterium]|nr:ribosome biogenesis GTPase Der [Terriglobales bacterium]